MHTHQCHVVVFKELVEVDEGKRMSYHISSDNSSFSGVVAEGTPGAHYQSRLTCSDRKTTQCVCVCVCV